MANTMRDLKVALFLADPIVSDYSGPLSADPLRLKFVYEMYLTVSVDAPEDEILEMVFCTFNMNQPADYHHRSFSVGDVVTLDSNRSYICAPLGWQSMSLTLRSASIDDKPTSVHVETGGKGNALGSDQ
jgi:YodL-like